MVSYEDIANIIKQLDKKTLIIADSDLDGTTAAILMKKILKELNKDHSIYLRIDKTMGKKLINRIVGIMKEDKDIKNFIFLDTPLDDENLIFFANRNKNKKIIYIDHHKRKVPDNLPENLIYFDVRAIFNAEICTSNIVYKIGKSLFSEDFKRYSIISAVGAVGDYMFGNDEELLKDLMEKYGNIYNGKYFAPPFFLYYLFFMTVFPYVLLDDPDKDLELDEVIKNVEVKKLSNRFELYYKALKDLKNIYKDEKMEIYIGHMTGIVSTFLSAFKNKLIIILSKKRPNNIIERILEIIKNEEKYIVSVRTNNDIDVGKLMEEFTKKYGINGGGHPKAAGGSIYKRDLDKFIEFFKEKIK